MKTIAQSIREAALRYPLGFFGDVESVIVNYAFSDYIEPAIRQLMGRASVHARTYYLFVAEALE